MLTLEANRLVSILTDAVRFTSDDTSRPVLNAVKLTGTAGRCQVVATDSYVLGTWSSDAVGDLEVLISAADVKRIVVMVKAELKVIRSGLDVTLEATPRSADSLAELAVSVGTASLTVPILTGDFPAWRVLFEADVPIDGRACFAPHVLDKLAGVECGYKASKRRQAEAPALRFETHGRTKPASFSMTHEGITFVGLAMPYRCDTEGRRVGAPELIDLEPATA